MNPFSISDEKNKKPGESKRGMKKVLPNFYSIKPLTSLLLGLSKC